MAVSLHDIQERYLECSVCFQEYNDEENVPRFLPCNHTYCETCLRTMMRNNGIKCPQCNKEHRVENIHHLQKDNTRRDLRTFLEENKEDPFQYQSCNICPENIPARLHCNSCQFSMCVYCFKEKHKYEGTIAHSFTNIHHENFLPDKFTTCDKPGHENGSLKYFSKSQILGKPGCATCILEENSEMLSKKLNFSKDILEQRYAYINEEKGKLSSLENSINSEISLIDVFMDDLVSQSSLLYSRVKALCNSDTNTARDNKAILNCNIDRAKKNDRHILGVAMRTMKKRLSHINECYCFLNFISEIDDALLFCELYTYIHEMVDNICGMPLESVNFTNISALGKCGQMVDEMEKNIIMKKEENKKKEEDMINLENEKFKDYERKTTKDKFEIRDTSTRVCVVIMIAVAIATILSLPAKWVFELDHWLFVPDKEVKLSIQSGNDKSSYQSGSDLSSYHRGNKISSYHRGNDISSYLMLPIAQVNSDWLSLLPFFFPLLPGFLITYIVLQYCMNRAMTNVAKRNRVRARRPTQRQLDQLKIR